MEHAICLDSDIIIDFLRGEKEATKFIKQHDDCCTLATTTINIFELYRGAYNSKKTNKNLDQMEELIRNLFVLNFTPQAAQIAAKIDIELSNKGMPIDPRDLFIASTAKTFNFAVKTNNKKHFERIPGLTIL